ncbi:lactose ABC transporter permease [Weizmannia acidilactici]|uniref:Lactose ABC transporter permease n=2 Tax=Heyndrickxia TaxID=2837504 RepID=A0A5J4JH79_9BACI|nr:MULTISPECIES: carbohydrate ABC transporter permease [Heyndrickxia]KWZ80826.1 ABC transporter, permease protein [Heyndrickxia coagulans]GER67584.1 lactose ABC transporter permease [Weizmannia acidilactici]GER69807.1 lactose ABC transporter permease [Weizmannia acidilactici]GER73671.1 lactose ABC transporter permease [Weizmannia acidilactici]
MPTSRIRRIRDTIGLYVPLIIALFISIFPFYWMLVGATNNTSKMFTNPPTLSFGNRLMENLHNLNDSIGIYRVLFNSLFVSLMFVLLSLTVCTLAAYALSKFRFKGDKIIFTVLMLSMMIPYQATLIPLFRMLGSLHLLNTYFALIVPQLCYPFAIFLMRQNFLAFPDALIESARIDGAGELRIFFRIVLPSMKPALAATAIYLFMMQWNNFMWPLVATTSSDMYTFPVALSSLIGISIIDYGQVMMGITIATIPIIIFFLVLQKQFISGMLGSAVK